MYRPFERGKAMKCMIASDIHGSGHFCEKLLDRYHIEKPDRLILLGDILYHGPRNRLPDRYDPPKVIELLNGMGGELLCVRGNCDTEVDQMVLQFPILAEYAILFDRGHMMFLTHGHRFGEQNPPLLHKGDVLLCGHTHVPKCAAYESFVYLNPGSVSIPKAGSCHSYMVYEEGAFVWKDLDGQSYMEYTLD